MIGTKGRGLLQITVTIILLYTSSPQIFTTNSSVTVINYLNLSFVSHWGETAIKSKRRDGDWREERGGKSLYVSAFWMDDFFNVIIWLKLGRSCSPNAVCKVQGWQMVSNHWNNTLHILTLLKNPIIRFYRGYEDFCFCSQLLKDIINFFLTAVFGNELEISTF